MSAVTAVLLACAGPSSNATPAQRPPGSAAQAEPVEPACVLPTAPEVLIDGDGLVLKVWSFGLRDVHSRPVLPDDSGFLAYRAAVRADGADVLQPVADPPLIQSAEEAAIWRDEYYNNALAFSGEVGSIGLITCLDALLFAEQNSRVAQLVRPTEFLASVLRRDAAGSSDAIVVFGAGSELFIPSSVYGFDVVDEYIRDGWSFWYTLHNHTLQRNGDRIALGVPVPSTSDVQIARSLVEARGMQRIRVTNGFYTFDAPATELSRFRGR